MGKTERPMLPLPNPDDWATIDAVSERLHCSPRTVGRMIDAKTLTGYHLRTAQYETQRVYLWWPEVEEVASARERLGRS
jgi:AraC-like DNA-binding protein